MANGHSAPAPAPIPQLSEPLPSQEPPLRSTTPPADFAVAREESAEPPEEILPPVSVFVQPPPEPAPPIEHTRSLSPGPPNDEILIKYQDAQAEIERLRSLLAAAAPPQELRHRRTHSYDDDNTTIPGSDVGTIIIDDQHQDGVPLNVVVIISLGVFIITYLFF